MARPRKNPDVQGAPLTADFSEAPTHSPLHGIHAAEQHVETTIHDSQPTEWRPPSNLDAPLPRKGFKQRWKRVNLGSAPDTNNRAAAASQGWMPRSLDTVPEGERHRYPAIKHGNGYVISVQGSILCEQRIELAKQRKAHYDAQRKRQFDALVTDNIASENAKRRSPGYGPIQIDRKSSVDVRRPHVAPDEA